LKLTDEVSRFYLLTQCAQIHIKNTTKERRQALADSIKCIID